MLKILKTNNNIQEIQVNFENIENMQKTTGIF